MRKNKLTGAIPNAGRHKGTEEKHTVHLTITENAKKILDQKPRMDKGNFVSGLIEGSEGKCDCGSIDGLITICARCCKGYTGAA